MGLQSKPDCWVVEVDDEEVGILLQDGAGYRFVAAARRAAKVDRTIYASVSDALRTVRAVVRQG